MHNKGSNQSLVKVTNQNLILREIRTSGQLSRSELAKRLQLSNPSVSKHVDDLIAKGLLIETGSAITDIGRRPIMLQFNGNRGCVAVIDLSSNDARLCVANLLGSKLEYSRVDCSEVLTAEDMDRIIQNLHDMLAHLGDRCGELTGVCVGTPGLVDPESGRIIRSARFGANSEVIDLVGILGRTFDVPVIVRNDINLAVVGEHKFGAAQNHSSVLLLSIESGTAGLGAVIDGRLFTGAHGFGCNTDSLLLPEWGSSDDMVPLPDMLRLDRLADSVREVISDGRESLMRQWLSDPSELTFDDVARAWGMSDIACSAVVRRYARLVAIVCHSLTALFDPELVLLGGQVTRLGTTFVSEVIRFCEALTGVTADIQLAKLSDSAVIFGGIDHATHQAIDRIVCQ